MRKIILLIFVFFIIGCTNKAQFENKNSIKIAIATDIHYFAKEYYEQCDWFEEQMLYGDGKMVTYGDEILNAFIDSVISNDVDLVLLTGDLTFNGEVNSHKILASKLNKLEENGIKVAVLPGNHDLENIYSKGFGKDDYFEVSSITSSEFRTIYGNLGFDLSFHKHKESLSYEILFNDNYTLLLVDSNQHELTGSTSMMSSGKLTESTEKWLVKRLEVAKRKKCTPIIALHHNLGIHNDVLNDGYTINDNERLASLFKEYNVPLVLSGHIHLQSILDIEGIKEIVTSSLVDNPLQYGLLEVNDEKMIYDTRRLKISVDPSQYFDTVSRNTFYNEESGEDVHLKREVMTLVNNHYFAGTISSIKDEVFKMKGYHLIMEEKDSFTKAYLLSMLKNDGNNITIELNRK